MTETELELARELARHPGWKWMRGMSADGTWGRWLCGNEPPKGFVPDLADPATQGCLMAALGDQLQVVETFYPSLDPGAAASWRVEAGDGEDYPWASEGSTLGEALARAWLAVNGEEPKP